MANFLDQLLSALGGQSQSGAAPWMLPNTGGVYQTPPIAGPPDAGEDILVTANEQPQRPPELDIPSAPPMKTQKVKTRINDNSTNRPGMFGMRGTLRDVIGLIGDSLIKGGDTPYQDKRKQERLSDNLVGFADNPQEFMKAVNRVADNDPDFAAKLFQVGASQQNAEAARESLENNRQSQIAERDYKRKQDFGNWAGQVLAYAPDKAKAMEMVAKRAGSLGFDLAELGIDETVAEDLGRGATKVNQQDSARLSEERNDISRTAEEGRNTRNAQNEAGRNRRYSPRAQANPTAASLAAPIISKLERGEKLTPQQNEVLKRLGFDSTRGDPKPRASAALPPVKPEGSKIKNKSTGETLVSRGGKWVKE